MLSDFDGEASAAAVARSYAPFIDGFVVDRRDPEAVPRIQRLGLHVHVTDTLMTDGDARMRLAAEVLAFALDLGSRDRR
jgi:LPPG:FO 2-phospho-L-lactate transferase